MSRRNAALKPQLNRIRAWAHEGSTDAWIAHQLDTTADAVRAFRQEHGIERGGPAPLAPITPDSVVEAMLAEEAAALEAGPEPDEPAAVVESAPRRRPGAARASAPPPPRQRPRTRSRPPRTRSPKRPRRATRHPPRAAAVAGRAEVPAARPRPPPQSPRLPPSQWPRRPLSKATTRALPRRLPTTIPCRARASAVAAGADAVPHAASRRACVPGSVLVLDPSVTSDATFQEHWANAGALRVEVSADAIVLRRAAADAEPDQPAG